MATRFARLIAVGLAVFAVAGCSSVGGSATAASGPSASSSAGSTTNSAEPSAGGTSTSVAGQRFPLCPAVPIADIKGLSDCVHRDLVTYWQRLTKQQIDRPVVIEPTFLPEPQECFAPQSIYAYYCPSNRTIYVNTSMLTLWKTHFSADQVPYSLAMTLAHEVGHAAQFAVDPALQNSDTSQPAISRKIELQADCLAGVWAHSEIAAGRMDRSRMLTVWRQELNLLNTPEHEKMHDDPAARIVSTERGLNGGSMSTCGLRVG